MRRASAATIRWRLSRGNSVPGHPLFWAVSGERLYLFYSGKARAAFLADPGRYIEAADAQMAGGRAHHRTLEPRTARPRESGDLGLKATALQFSSWIPAYAGMSGA